MDFQIGEQEMESPERESLRSQSYLEKTPSLPISPSVRGFPPPAPLSFTPSKNQDGTESPEIAEETVVKEVAEVVKEVAEVAEKGSCDEVFDDDESESEEETGEEKEHVEETETGEEKKIAEEKENVEEETAVEEKVTIEEKQIVVEKESAEEIQIAEEIIKSIEKYDNTVKALEEKYRLLEE